MLNKPEFPIFFFGLFVSLLSGVIQPAYAVLYSEMFKVSLRLFVDSYGWSQSES